MGKSETARMFRHLGVPVFDADATVHALQGPGGKALPAIEHAFPGTTNAGGVDRQTLGQKVFGDRAALRRLEAIIHPMVGAARRRFLKTHARARRPLVVLDIPLLFEGTGPKGCDVIVVASAPGFLQKQRVLRRPGMTQEKFRSILKRQVPDVIKRRRADLVVRTGLGKGPAFRVVQQFLESEMACGTHCKRRGRHA